MSDFIYYITILSFFFSKMTIDSSVFRCEIFENAVKVVVSDIVPRNCIASENVVWELSDQGDLVSLCILDSTGELSEHCFKELEANK